MEKNHLISLRLGFSTEQAKRIQDEGITAFIQNQLNAENILSEPECIKVAPKSFKEIKNLKKAAKKNREELIKVLKTLNQQKFEWKAFLIQRCTESENPLREKINHFFHNHFVATMNKVSIPLWIYQHYNTINTHSLGNYKNLVKEMLYTNALIVYLDNQKNQKGKINENLGRELLELFTLGEGHYSEGDIRNAALALAGLGLGPEKGKYNQKFKDNSTKTFMGKTGNFIIDDVVDIIFEQENTPYFLTEKVLKWFYYDNPSKELVKVYGGVLKEHNFELKPFFQELFENESHKNESGTQLKNPLLYIIQVHKDLNLIPNYKFMTYFTSNQAMNLYEQPNVKGWKGGEDWLTSQTYYERNLFIDNVINGNQKYVQKLQKRFKKYEMGDFSFNPTLTIENSIDAQSILNELVEKMIFNADEDMWAALNELLPYDFDPKSEHAEKSILKIYRYLAQSPEFQVI